MIEWWTNLTALNQVFYVLAGLFSLVFLWQFIATVIGLGGGELEVNAGHADVDFAGHFHADAHVEVDSIEGHSAADAAETIAAFRLLSIRAILAFCTLFTWAGALYLDGGKSVERSLLYAALWGLGAWLVITLLVNWMRKLTETGTLDLRTCVGATGTVYLNIPAAGQGEVRVLVSGVVKLVKARGAGGAELKAGTPVRVARLLNGTTVEVEPC